MVEIFVYLTYNAIFEVESDLAETTNTNSSRITSSHSPDRSYGLKPSEEQDDDDEKTHLQI